MNRRSIKILLGFALVGMIYIGRLAVIQLGGSNFLQSSRNNSLQYQDVNPPRGLIYDRNGLLLVDNSFAYDIMVCPKETTPFDTLLLAHSLGMEVKEVEAKFSEYRRKGKDLGYLNVTFAKNVSEDVYNRFREISYQFPGFSTSMRTMRKYPYNAGGALLGYISEVSASDLERHPDYRRGSYIGKTGIEATMDAVLRGEPGYEIYVRDHNNRIISRYEDGAKDLPARSGGAVTVTIDAPLQHYAQSLMKGKIGSLVAIEPSTGEILTLVSSPTVDVDILAAIGENYSRLASDPAKPMFNRAVQASYPPGSVFKTINALIGLQEGVVTPQTRYPCHRGYSYAAGRKLGCHDHRSPIDLEEGIMMSCNAYFCYVFKDLVENPKYGSYKAAYDHWREYVTSFGFGEPLGSDFPSELRGNLPTSDYYDKIYGKGSWRASNIISLSIGQGEIGCTPLHLANLCATIANRGWYCTPHIVRSAEGITPDPRFREHHLTKIDPKHFETVVSGMYRAVNSGPSSGGTASRAAVPGLEICGKTGTAQNPHGMDNSVFMCFAPRENPQIAVIAYVEQGGFGASTAAPIASLVVEKYLNGEISDSRRWMENDMLNLDIMDRYALSGK